MMLGLDNLKNGRDAADGNDKGERMMHGEAV